MTQKEKIKTKIEKLKKTGFFSIFIATVFSKVITLLGGIILVRILSKSDYGIYSYVHNCYSMLFLLNDFGIATAALQYLTENFSNQEKQRAILRYSIISCLVASIVTALLILLSPYFYPYTITEAKQLTPMLFLLPTITSISGLLSVVLRANFENKKYSRLQIFTTAITYIILIAFSVIWGLNGAIFSQYIYSLIILGYSIFLTYQYLHKLRDKLKVEQKIRKEEKKGFLKYAIASQLNNTVGGLMHIVDTFLIGYLIAQPEVIATYNVGSKIPHALTFLTTCITIYITPHFIKHNKDFKWLKKNFKTLMKYSLLGFGIICIGLIIFAKPIFAILFGSQYYDAIPVYVILVIGLFFTSALKGPCANILSALRKIKINIVTNTCCVVVNFISNIFFIQLLGVLGAAITTTATNIIVSIVYVIYLKRYLKRKEQEISDTE